MPKFTLPESFKLGLTLLSVLLWLYSIEFPKRAFRLYERGDIEKAVQLLNKSIETDTLNPASYGLYAEIYIDTAFKNYHVDTAYLYVNKALQQLQWVSDEKDRADLREFGISEEPLTTLRHTIDSLRFEEIRIIHTIAAYDLFIETHPDAKQISKAISLRDHIAFQQVEAQHTWQAYKAFMEQYPEAEAFAQAETLYKKLIYEEQTADGSLSAYLSFLEEFPGTPYRSEIVEKLFRYTTARNQISDYKNFLQHYADKRFMDTIIKRIYPIYKARYGAESFVRSFPFAASDSLSRAIQQEKGYWLPALRDDQLVFMTSAGSIQLKTGLTQIDDDCKCDPLFEDIAYGQKDGMSQVIARDGHIIAEGSFQSFKDAGYGFIIAENEDGQQLFHKSGEIFIDEPKQEIAVLSESFIRVKENGLYGLQALHGFAYLPTEFIQIDTLLHYFLLEKQEGIAIVPQEKILNSLHKALPTLSFSFQEIDYLPNGRIWAIKNNQEAILSSDLNIIIPFDDHRIDERPYGWQVRKKEGFQIYHDRFPLLKDSLFDAVQENTNWLGLKTRKGWSLYHQYETRSVEYNIDSLQLLGENLALVFKGESQTAIFRNGRAFSIPKAWEPQLLVPQINIKTGAPATEDFFMLTNDRKQRKVYNVFGREIANGTINGVTALGPNMLRLQKRNAALTDSTGKFLLNYIYDGIGSNETGYVSIADKGTLGVINPALKILIKPEYEKLIRPYNDSLLVATKGSYQGIITKDNEQLTAFEFDEVKYFNDSLALVRIEKEWLLENIYTEEILIDRMLDYTILTPNKGILRLQFTTEEGIGIYKLGQGKIVAPTYTEVIQLGTDETPIYFASKFIEEADIYVIIYYDENGNKFFTQSLRKDDYFKIACTIN